jgi:hypothetical protein
VAFSEPHEVARYRACIFQSQHRAATDGAPLRFDRVAGKRRQRHGEGFAANAQCFNRTLHLGSLAGIKPAAERKHAMRLAHAEDFRIAIDVRPVGSRRPVHRHLLFGEQQSVGAIEFVAQPRDLVT